MFPVCASRVHATNRQWKPASDLGGISREMVPFQVSRKIRAMEIYKVDGFKPQGLHTAIVLPQCLSLQEGMFRIGEYVNVQYLNRLVQTTC